MAFEIEYFHERVRSGVESWTVEVLADYARLVELLAEHGPSLRLPHSRALGDGRSSFALAGAPVLAARSTASWLANESSLCTRSLRSLSKRPTAS